MLFKVQQETAGLELEQSLVKDRIIAQGDKLAKLEEHEGKLRKLGESYGIEFTQGVDDVDSARQEEDERQKISHNINVVKTAD